MSIKKVFDVALDIKRPSSHKDFTVINGDTGNRIHITLTDGDDPVNISGCRIIAAFSRSDGSTSLQDSGMQDGGVTIGGVENNEVSIDLFPASFSPGMVECELQIYSDSSLSTLVTTARFNFSCRKAIINPDTVQASPEYPLLRSLTDELKSSADGLSQLMETAERAEASRALAESQREEAALRFANLSAEVTMLSAEAAPTASVTDTESGKHITLGIPAGPKGDTGQQGIQGEKGDTGEQGPQGIPGLNGANGATFIPSVQEDGMLSWSNDGGLDNPAPVNIKGPKGDTGEQGIQGEKGDTGEQGPQGLPGNNGSDGSNGATFIPSVAADGTLSWSNDGELDNPAAVNIKGPKGDTGEQGIQGEKGDTGEQGIQGPKGDTGAGFAVLGYFPSADALSASVQSPVPGDAYGVGDAQPYDIYIWDGINSLWVNNGPLQGAKGDTGEQGPQGVPGNKGDDGANGVTFTPSVAADGTLSWSNDGGLENPASVSIKGPKGDTGEQGVPGEKGDTGEQGPQGVPGSKGDDGANGVTFTPSVAADGTLSWSNDGGLENPASVNIKGPSGSAWIRESYVEPYWIEAEDAHEYYFTEITELGIDLPTTDIHEFWMQIEWQAGDYEPLFMFFPDIPFIGGQPVWESGFTYEVSVKNGVAVAAKVGDY